MTIRTYNVGEIWSFLQEATRRQLAAMNDDDKKAIGKASRDWYRIACWLLRTYYRRKNWPNGPDQAPVESIPIVFAAVLANQLGYLATGALPAPMREAMTRGRHAPGPHESKDMGIAIAYIKAARQGAIPDSSPLRTVADAYGISRDTVKRWQRKLSWVSPRDFYASAADGEHGALLKSGMVEAGNRYRNAGRSRIAIQRRNSKSHSSK